MGYSLAMSCLPSSLPLFERPTLKASSERCGARRMIRHCKYSAAAAVGTSVTAAAAGARGAAGARVAAALAAAEPVAVSVQEFLEEAQGFGKVHVFISSFGERFTAMSPVSSLSYVEKYPKRPRDAVVEYRGSKTQMNFVIKPVAWVSFKQDKVLGVPHYIVQFLDKQKLIVFCFTLTHNTDPQTDEYLQQVETYHRMLEKYGPDLKFTS